MQIKFEIETAKFRKEHTISVFFGLTKTYERTWKLGIMKKLHELQIGNRLPAFIGTFLSNRQIRLKVESPYSGENHLD